MKIWTNELVTWSAFSNTAFNPKHISRDTLKGTHLHATLPADPQVSPGQKAGHSVPSQAVDPSLLPQLGHDGVNPRESCASFGPFGQCLWVLIPGDLHTDGIARHLVKCGIARGYREEELSPEQLGEEDYWRLDAFVCLVERMNTYKFLSYGLYVCSSRILTAQHSPQDNHLL